MTDAILLFTQSDCALLTAIAPELFHMLVGEAITIGVPATLAFSSKQWMAIVRDLILNLIPWDQTVMDAHVEP